MPLELIDVLATGFEGCEKRLEIDFVQSGSLRDIPRSVLDTILEEAKCTIISCSSNDKFDSYVLSESSLFVFPHKFILKTCGTTSLLHCLPKLLPAASKYADTKPEFVQFSRCNFMFPDQQSFPHRSFAMEAQYLNTFFKNGNAYVLGPINGPRWHLYTADMNLAVNKSENQTFEVVMFDLDKDAMRVFFKKDEGADKEGQEGYSLSGKDATVSSGISEIIPGATIDEFLFEPCGYSCNALLDSTYFTIHVTPEEECSFVSFETNLLLEDYTPLLEKVVNMFKPGFMLTTLFLDDQQGDAVSLMPSELPGFFMRGQTKQDFDGFYNAVASQFNLIEERPVSRYGSGAPSAPRSLMRVPSSDTLLLRDELSHDIDESFGSFAVPYHVAKNLTHSHLTSLAVASVQENHDVLHVHDAVAEEVVRTLINSVRAEAHSLDEDSAVATSTEAASSGNIDESGVFEDPFYIVDLGSIISCFERWMKAFPRIAPFHKVHCNADIGVLTCLSSMGCSFSASNEAEAKRLLSLNVDPAHIYLARPFKPSSLLKFAAKKKIRMVACDSVKELAKIKRFHPHASIMIVVSDGFSPVVDGAVDHAPKGSAPRSAFGMGISREMVFAILKEAARLKVHVSGVSFSVRSRVLDANGYGSIIRRAGHIFDEAAASLGYPLSVLDIGPGFPVGEPSTGDAADNNKTAAITVESIAPALNASLDKYFPASRGVRIIARPSRFLVSASHTLVTSVIAKRDSHSVHASRNGGNVESKKEESGDDTSDHASSGQAGDSDFMYYINDGLYGSFNCLMYGEKVEINPHVLLLSPEHHGATMSSKKDRYDSTVFGHTCDGTDRLGDNLAFPELYVGDCLYFHDMGAYTVSMSTNFNGFDAPTVHYVCSTSHENCNAQHRA